MKQLKRMATLATLAILPIFMMQTASAEYPKKTRYLSITLWSRWSC